MADKIKMGTILYQADALLPESLRFESEAYSNGWRLVKNLDASGLDRIIHDAGWTFFYVAGEVKASVFGLGGEKAVRRAVNKLIASMKSDRLNSLEIMQVAAKRFLGLPYVTVSAHPRHVQESMFLSYDERVAKCGRAESVVVST